MSARSSGPTGTWNVVASEAARSPQLKAGSPVGATMISRLAIDAFLPGRGPPSAWRAFASSVASQRITRTSACPNWWTSSGLGEAGVGRDRDAPGLVGGRVADHPPEGLFGGHVDGDPVPVLDARRRERPGRGGSTRSPTRRRSCRRRRRPCRRARRGMPLPSPSGGR